MAVHVLRKTGLQCLEEFRTLGLGKGFVRHVLPVESDKDFKRFARAVSGNARPGAIETGPRSGTPETLRGYVTLRGFCNSHVGNGLKRCCVLPVLARYGHLSGLVAVDGKKAGWKLF
jgi:hypothetical protein